jgi:hypothetical protein
MYMRTEISESPESGAQWKLGNEYYGEGASFECGAQLTPAGHGSWTLSTPCPSVLSFDEDDAGNEPIACEPDIFERAMF